MKLLFIITNDVRRYIFLLYERGYINKPLTERYKQNSKNTLNRHHDKYLRIPEEIIEGGGGTDIAFLPVVTIAWFVVGVASQAIATYNVLAGVNVIASVDVAYYVALYTSVKTSGVNDVTSTTSSSNLLNMWRLKTEQNIIGENYTLTDLIETIGEAERIYYK